MTQLTTKILQHCHCMCWPIIVALCLAMPANGQVGGPETSPSFTTSPHDAAAPRSKFFATTFALVERPISHGDVWHHLGNRWAVVHTDGRHAFGTQTGHDGYDDSYAYLNGFGPDQQAEAMLWLDPAVKGNYREFELLLRWADTATTARGYECNLAWNGAYAEIVRWNGPYGDFTYITRETHFAPGVMPPRTGDIFKATITGDVIRVFLDKRDGQPARLIATGTDRTYPNGDPGIGFFIQGRLDPAQFGFSRFSASSE